MAAIASAAPMLRLSNTVVSANAAVGGTAASQSLFAENAGDGTLSPSAVVDLSPAWISVSVGGLAESCSGVATCYPIQFVFQSASLAAGMYTARVTISDPNAIDSPQVIIVTLQVGPTPINRYLAPDTSASVTIGSFCNGFSESSCPGGTVSTAGGGDWLSLTIQMEGTIGFEEAVLSPAAGLALGTYTGNIALPSGNLPVTMHVVQPPVTMANPSTNQIDLRVAQNGPAATYPFLPYVSLTDSNGTPIAATGVSGSGTGVSAYNYQGLAIVTVNPGSLAPGVYADGLVTIQCTASNCPILIPVSIEVIPRGSPVAAFQGVVDNATFQPTGSPGDVMIVRGEQLSLEPPQYSSEAPLPTTLGGASVLVNGVATPLYYSSFGQIAFQVRQATTLGTAFVQVFRDGQYGNTVSVNMAQYSPGIVVITDASYNVIDTNHPAIQGETVVLWALGLGPTSPPVADGAASPSGPPAVTTAPFSVNFGSFNVVPSFVGLSPGSVGLYQIAANVPVGVGHMVDVFLKYPDGTLSVQAVPIGVQ